MDQGNRPRQSLVDYVIRRTVAFLALLIATSIAPAVAQLAPIGSEFQANSFTTANQYRGDVATDGSGNFVVVWGSGMFAGISQDGESFGVFGQRFASGGAKLGSEFLVNSYTAGPQFEGRVAAAPGGDFLVVWRDGSGLDSGDGSSAGIFGQLFDSSGATVGIQFQVNSYTFTQQIQPDVAADGNGAFVAVWASQADNSIFGIFGQRFASDGTPIGGEFQINTFTVGRQDTPSVAADASGGFVVTWKSENQDGSGYGVFGQRFASSGAATGTEFQINSFTIDDQQFPEVASAATGAFVVVWSSYLQDGSYNGLFGQRFDSAGMTAGSEFQVNVNTVYSQYLAAVASQPDGGFLVTWSDYLGIGDGYAIVGRLYDSSGAAVGSPFQVSISQNVYPRQPRAAAAPAGNYVVVWQSFAQDGDDQGMFGVRLQEGGITPAPPLLPQGVPVLSPFATLAAVVMIAGLGLWRLRRARIRPSDSSPSGRGQVRG